MPVNMKKVNPHNPRKAKTTAAQRRINKGQCLSAGGAALCGTDNLSIADSLMFGAAAALFQTISACLQHSRFHELIPGILSPAAPNRHRLIMCHPFFFLILPAGICLYKQGSMVGPAKSRSDDGSGRRPPQRPLCSAAAFAFLPDINLIPSPGMY